MPPGRFCRDMVLKCFALHDEAFGGKISFANVHTRLDAFSPSPIGMLPFQNKNSPGLDFFTTPRTDLRTSHLGGAFVAHCLENQSTSTPLSSPWPPFPHPETKTFFWGQKREGTVRHRGFPAGHPSQY
eukprot:scaffold285_cov330-Pavlova_lutheri.AAC.105